MIRRDFLATCVSPALLAMTKDVASASTHGEQLVRLLLKETVGLRRFGYPVHVNLPMDFSPAGISDDDSFTLKRDGQDVPAQFRRVRRRDGTSLVSLDFNASPGAFEIHNYTVHHNPGLKTAVVKGRGMSVQRNGSTIEVSHSPHIRYAVSEELAGFVRSVKIPSDEFMKGDSLGLFVAVKGQKTAMPLPALATKPGPMVRIGRQGPLAIGLQSDCEIEVDGPDPVASLIDMTFPSSKSWVETVWTLNDPRNQIEAMGVDLGLLVDEPPIVVDCGAKSTVYATIKDRELITFEAGRLPLAQGIVPSWVIRHGTAEKSDVIAMMRQEIGTEPEGWIHVIDKRRCTAIAVAEFGRAVHAALDRFEFHGNGRFRFERRFLTEKIGQGTPRIPIKTLRFWLHFVSTPVQVGAATSPQSILAPLDVEWSRA